MNLQLTLNNRALTLLPDGTITGPANGAAAPTGTWQTKSGSRTNRLELAVTGAPVTNIAVNYQVTAANQIQVSIPVQAGVTTAVAGVAFNGRIDIDDNRDIVYYCTDDNGNDTNLCLYVYGDLSFDQATDRLYLTPVGATTKSFITGARPGNNVLVGKQQISNGGQLQPIDQLRFAALTTNTTASGTTYTKPARIEFLGQWNFVANQLAFQATLNTQSGTTPAVAIGFAGKFGSTNAGLVYYSDASGTTAAFTIGGQIACNNTTGNWELSLGYAANKLTGKLVVDTTTTTASGGKLKLAGSVALDQGPNLAISLDVDYTWQGNQLHFQVSNPSGGYALSLSGTFRIANSDVNFDVAYNPKDPTKTLTVSLGNLESDSNMKISLQAIVGKKGVTLSANLTFSVTWIDGVMVPS